MANDSEERQAVSPVAESSEQTVEQTEVEQTTGQAETSGVSPEASELVTFEDGDIITDGEETIGIFKKEFDNYYEMYIEGHFRDGELKYLYFDTISFKNENVTSDLSYAKVYLSIFGVDDKQKVVDEGWQDFYGLWFASVVYALRRY